MAALEATSRAKIHLRTNGLGLPGLLGDKGYDADAILVDLEARAIAAVIPPKRNRKVQPIVDDHLYERCFSKLKHSRRLATRYDKTADRYIAFVLAASARLWIRRFGNRT